MTPTIRAFIAIELNENIRNLLAKIQGYLKQLECDIKWVKPQNLHITIKFLGDVALQQLDAIKEGLQTTMTEIQPFAFTLTELGTFPDAKRPRVVWVGIDDQNLQAKKIAELTENTLAQLGFKKEDKKFSPHITIGRIKSNKNLHQLSMEIKRYPLPTDIVQSITHISVYKSTLTPSGPIYEVLDKIQLF